MRGAAERGDADEGEDKLEKSARREGKTAWDVAKFYGDYFVKALDRLNITPPAYLPKATEHIAEQIDLDKPHRSTPENPSGGVHPRAGR